MAFVLCGSQGSLGHSLQDVRNMCTQLCKCVLGGKGGCRMQATSKPTHWPCRLHALCVCVCDNMVHAYLTGLADTTLHHMVCAGDCQAGGVTCNMLTEGRVFRRFLTERYSPLWQTMDELPKCFGRPLAAHYYCLHRMHRLLAMPECIG